MDLAITLAHAGQLRQTEFSQFAGTSSTEARNTFDLKQPNPPSHNPMLNRKYHVWSLRDDSIL